MELKHEIEVTDDAVIVRRCSCCRKQADLLLEIVSKLEQAKVPFDTEHEASAAYIAMVGVICDAIRGAVRSAAR